MEVIIIRAVANTIMSRETISIRNKRFTKVYFQVYAIGYRTNKIATVFNGSLKLLMLPTAKW